MGLQKEDEMAKYGKKAQDKVHKALHEHKHEGKYQSRKQAIAVGLSQARRTGGKAPKNPNDND